MEEMGSVMLAKPTPYRPKLVVARRDPHEGFRQGGLNSGTPTPLIFGSSLGADRDLYTDCKSILSLLTETPGSPKWAPAAPVDRSAFNQSATDIPTHSRPELSAEVKLEVPGEDHGDSQLFSSARYKAMVPSRIPITSSSPHLTIPPGISPTSFLESPILLSTRQMDASPTTGSFSIPPDTRGEGLPNMGEYGVRSPERNDSFAFKPLPHVEGYGSPPNISMGTFEMRAQGNSRYSDGHHMQAEDGGYGRLPASDWHASSISSTGLKAQDHREASAAIQPADMPPLTSFQGADTEPASLASGVTSNGRPSVDGYNWKKYGQKTLKNCENPRNYYKCTYPNCPAKKLVESSNGQDVIIYKGKHNHAKPDGNRRRVKTVVHSSAAVHADHARDSRAGSKAVRASNFEDMPSASYAASHGGLPGTPELSFTSPSDEDENGDASIVGYDSEEESHQKRRRLDGEEENQRREALRAVREPRVTVQTVSVKDIIDDGYRWRKYGQKVVKGNRFPRQYYKCTNAGCRVKKLVERSSTDTKSVMTTYEGKHNHDVPPPRGSAQESTDMDAFCEDDSHSDFQDQAGGSESNSYVF